MLFWFTRNVENLCRFNMKNDPKTSCCFRLFCLTRKLGKIKNVFMQLLYPKFEKREKLPAERRSTSRLPQTCFVAMLLPKLRRATIRVIVQNELNQSDLLAAKGGGKSRFLGSTTRLEAGVKKS